MASFLNARTLNNRDLIKPLFIVILRFNTFLYYFRLINSLSVSKGGFFMQNEKYLIVQSSKYHSKELKQFILSNNLHVTFNKARSVYSFDNDLGVVPDGMDASKLKCYRSLYNYFWRFPETAQECVRLIDAKRQRTNRLENKISLMLNNQECLFLTLTFKDSVFESTNELTRRRYVSRYLASVSQYYIANIDYGEKNGREHYHAVVNGPIDLNQWRVYGNINVERINKPNSSIKLSKYISKLTNHAIKNTCKNKKIIYSKNWSSLHILNKINDFKKDSTVALGFELLGETAKAYQTQGSLIHFYVSHDTE